MRMGPGTDRRRTRRPIAICRRTARRTVSKTLVAKDAARKVRVGQASRPHCNLMDIVMPGMNGLQATANRQDPDTSTSRRHRVHQDQEADRVWGLRQGRRQYLDETGFEKRARGDDRFGASTPDGSPAHAQVVELASLVRQTVRTPARNRAPSLCGRPASTARCRGRRMGGRRFPLGNERFVRPRDEVARSADGAAGSITRVPGAQRWLRGLANVRGHLLPLVDLRILLGSGRTALTGAVPCDIRAISREIPGGPRRRRGSWFPAIPRTGSWPTTCRANRRLVRYGRFLAGSFPPRRRSPGRCSV